jgi:hypothetical protein
MFIIQVDGTAEYSADAIDFRIGFTLKIGI